MSLVERAIKKMQAAAGGGGNAPRAEPEAPRDGQASRLAAGVVGEVVRTGTHRALDPASGDPGHRSDKLVRVDRQALRHAGLMPPEHQERVLSDQYRQIKRPLISNASGRGATKLANGQLIMMSSAMPGEGKTFTSINLALSLALEKDVTVLLVDGDIPKPHISRIFGLEQEPGLIELLHDHTLTSESVILPTDVPNLQVLPAGQRSETATELLASVRMEKIMRELAASNPRRILLIDTPPLLLTSESRAVANAVGQVVLVVRAGHTPHQAVLDAIDLVGEGKWIGLVLNQSNTSPAGYYYGYAGEEPSA